MKVCITIFCVSLILLVLAVPVFAQQAQWSKIYTDSQGEGNCVIATSDGCFVIAGSSKGHFLLAKADSNGELLWTRTYQTGEANCVVQTSDGGYALAGSGEVNFIKTDASGNLQWSKNYVNTVLNMTFRVNSVIQAFDDGYVLAGYVPEGNAPQFDWTLRTSKNGEAIWNKTFGTVVAQSFAYDVVTVDDGFVLAANRKLYCLDDDGDVLWSEPSVWAGSLVKTSDGGYLVVSVDGAALTKTDAQGKTQWSNTFKLGSQYSFFKDAIQTSDGGYIACGQAYPSYEGVAWIVKVDSTGKQQYIKSAETFSGHNGFANSIIEVSKNVYVFSGAIKSISDASYSEVWLAKVSSSILSAGNSEFPINNTPNSSATTPSTPTPSIPELSQYAFLPIAVATTIFAATIIRHRSKSQLK
ncbi:MAG: PQQ-binding-like beta-propeller repeat protein [Candidatus Bathyarchaeia archaeon]